MIAQLTEPQIQFEVLSLLICISGYTLSPNSRQRLFLASTIFKRQIAPLGGTLRQASMSWGMCTSEYPFCMPSRHLPSDGGLVHDHKLKHRVLHS